MKIPGCPYSIKKVIPTRIYRIAEKPRARESLAYRWYSCLFVPACAGHEVAVEHIISSGAVQCVAYQISMPEVE